MKGSELAERGFGIPCGAARTFPLVPSIPLLADTETGPDVTGNVGMSRSLFRLSHLIDNGLGRGLVGIRPLGGELSLLGLFKADLAGIGLPGVGLGDIRLVGTGRISVRPLLIRLSLFRLLKKGLLGTGLTGIRPKELDISGTRLSCVNVSGIELVGVGSSGEGQVFVFMAGAGIFCTALSETMLVGGDH